MFKFFIDFIPWLIFSSLASSIGLLYSAIIMIIFLVVLSFQHLRKGFVLDWGAVIFFLIVAFTSLPQINWLLLGEHPNFYSTFALTLIMWVSLFIKKPFTLQYAKEIAPVEAHGSKVFKDINIFLTVAWSMLMSIATIIAFLHMQFHWSHSLSSTISIVAIVLGILCNKYFPDWYIARNYYKTIKDSTHIDHQYLQDGFAPVTDELDISNLQVHGTIPTDLNGTYMRNGPNPAFSPISYTFPFDGDGMIHAVSIKNNKASYRNRFVQTKAYQNERAVGKSIYPGIALAGISPPPELLKVFPEEEQGNGAFVNVIKHGDKILALLEAGSPVYELTDNLETRGEWTLPDGSKPTPNAHLHVDPNNQDLWGISYSLQPSFKIYQFDENLNKVHEYSFAKNHATMIHDFAFTENYIIIFDCPGVLSLDALLQQNFSDFLTWQPELGTTIYILDKANGNIVNKIKNDAFWVFHFVNAYENELGNITIDYVHYDELFSANDYQQDFHLARGNIDLQNSCYSYTKLHADRVEFPRMNERYYSKSYQYAYLAKFSKEAITSQCLMKYDFHNNKAHYHDFGDDIEIDEPLFVPRLNSTIEDEGYILLFSYQRSTDSSSLIILDAQNVANAPIATMQMPRRVPHGLHGNWMPNSL